MTRVESRKLLSISAVGAVLPQTMIYPAPEQQIYFSGLLNEIAFAVAVTEAEGYAYSLLGISLAIALKVQAGPPDGPEDICVQGVNQAMESLVQPPQEPSQAMCALNMVSRAVAFCPNQELRKSLDQAKQAIRDVLVWRTQAKTPWGNRPRFIAELEQANGAPLENISLAVLEQSELNCLPKISSSFLVKAKMERTTTWHH